MTRRDEVAAVILAAGLGTRFRSDLAKVMHEVAGRTMLRHILEALRPLELGQVVVVVGHQADEVIAEAEAADLEHLTTVLQEDQRGTGHAAAQALPALYDTVEQVLVLPGDAPLLTPATLEHIVAADGDADGVLATVDLDDPTGYGRIIRDDTGGVVAIVEEADASGPQRALTEVNAGIYRFDVAALGQALARLDEDNAQGEQYLTDVIGHIVSDQGRIHAALVPDDDVRGVNDRVQLADAGEVLRRRRLEDLMRAGVTIVDPASTYVDVAVEIGRDARLLPGCILEGETRIGERAVVGPYTRVVTSSIGEAAEVQQAVLIEAEVGAEAKVGPFAYLRPGTRLARAAKVGTFVELKQTELGEGSKAPHLSYLGDAHIGRDVNVGAGTITCNYDGVDKHETEIDDGAFIGSDTMLVAPIRVGKGAYTGAGSAITTDVPDDALAVERSDQRNIEGWAARRRDRGDT
jgi:bifunctional UDP-N-acetylglucosamine pyrophosphorylase / glucosamine-1-phosphate N-acetyltransferase